MPKHFSHPSNLHVKDRQAGVLQKHGLKGYGLLMVILEIVARSPNGEMLMSEAKKKDLARKYNCSVGFFNDVLTTSLACRIIAFSGEKIINNLSQKDTKAKSTKDFIYNEEKWIDFRSDLLKDPEFRLETTATLEEQRKLFIRYLQSSGKTYVDYCGAFKNWLNSEYRTNKPHGDQKDRISFSKQR